MCVCVYVYIIYMFVYAIYIHICVWRPHWWVSGKEPTCQAGDMGFDSWVRKMPCRRKWQPTPVFLLGKSHGRADPLEKTLILEKTEGGRRRGRQRMRWLEASLTQWTWVWVNCGSWWWTGRPGFLQSMVSKASYTTELLNTTELISSKTPDFLSTFLGYSLNSKEIYSRNKSWEVSRVCVTWKLHLFPRTLERNWKVLGSGMAISFHNRLDIHTNSFP